MIGRIAWRALTVVMFLIILWGGYWILTDRTMSHDARLELEKFNQLVPADMRKDHWDDVKALFEQSRLLSGDAETWAYLYETGGKYGITEWPGPDGSMDRAVRCAENLRAAESAGKAAGLTDEEIGRGIKLAMAVENGDFATLAVGLAK